MGRSLRIAYIDIMKGVAILCVVAGHYLPIPFLSTIIWSFHMPLFVFLNGYFWGNKGIQATISKSAKAYLKPYLIVWTVLLLSEILIAYFRSECVGDVAMSRLKSGLWALASNSTINKPEGVVKIGAIWFLIALFWGSVFMAFLDKVNSKPGQFALASFLLGGGVLLTQFFCVPLGLSYGIAFLYWIWIGQYYSWLKKKGSKLTCFFETKKAFFFSLVLWGGIVILEGLTHNRYNICWLRFPLFGLELIGAFLGIIVIRFTSQFIEKNSRVISKALQFLGASSLWILCVHAVDIELFPQLITADYSGRPVLIVFRCVIDILIAIILRQIYKVLINRPINQHII